MPCQIPNLSSFEAAVNLCPLLPKAVMTRSGSEGLNFLAVRMAPDSSSFIHMYSMYEKDGGVFNIRKNELQFDVQEVAERLNHA